MFTLNRLTTIGLGTGLVLVGCASPVGDAADETTAAFTAAEAGSDDETTEGLPEEVAMPLPKTASAFETPANAPVPAPPSYEAATDDAQSDPTSEKWLGWGGLGWGGFYPGFFGGSVYALPGYAYGYVTPFGYGYSRSIGYGTAWGYPYGGFW